MPKKDDLVAGTLLAFSVPHPNRTAPPPRIFVLKILETLPDGADIVGIALLDGVFDKMPSADALRHLGAAPRRPEAFWPLPPPLAPDGTPADLGVEVFHIAHATSPTEVTFTNIGRVRVSERERALLAECTSRSCWDMFAGSVDHHWRLAHDLPAVKAEQAAARARQEERARKARERLRGLSLATLLAEAPPFARWLDTPGPVPRAFTEKLQARSCGLLNDLAALAPKPRKAEARAALRGFVAWCNAADAEFDGPIETAEREDILTFLEEVAWACKHPGLADEVDGWRDW